ncbi:MAG TPA: LysR family transcriptional regulator [Verrucomicrobiae bacterium]|jgi:DNA-binding transcriptional LysR family regulator
MFRNLFQESGLSLERLHTFCLVAGAGGVTRAAGGDPTKQSQFSRQIKELEAYFGVELIRRNGRGLVLTGAGKQLAGIVHEHLTALTDFKSECDKRPFKITMAGGDSLMYWVILPRLARLKKRLPNTIFGLLNLKTAEILNRLKDGTIDFGVVRESGISSPLKASLLGIMSHSLFVSQQSNASSDVEKILCEFPVATLEGDGSFRRELTTAFYKHTCGLNIQLECSSFPLIARALKSHKAAAILPNIARCEFGDGSVVEIKTPLLKRFDRRIVLAWNIRNSRIRAVVEKARLAISEEIKF